jgi:hypothetical protein
MKSSYLLLLSIALSACNSSEKKKTTTIDSPAAAIHQEVVQEKLPDNFYKRLQGIIGDQNVVVQLTRVENEFSGNYNYNGTQVNLVLDTLIQADSLILKEDGLAHRYSDDTPVGPKLQLKWTGTSFSGFRVDGKKRENIHLEERYPEGSYAFKVNTYSDSLKAFPKKKQSPEGMIAFRYLQPVGNSPAERWLDKSLKKEVGIKNQDTPWSDGIKKMAKNYLEGYRGEISDLSEEDQSAASLNYYSNLQLFLEYNENGYVVVNQLFDSYSGGAHNNYASAILCFDVLKQKRLSLADILTMDSLSLQKVVEKNFRKQYNIAEGAPLSTELFEDHLAASNNFFFYNNGLAFLYNPYEVASFAQGQLIVFIPYTDVRKQLNPEFVKRMNIK